LFNFYTMVTSAWTLIRVAIVAFQCKDDENCHTFDNGVTVLAVIVMIFCALFALFCAVMFCDQVNMIVTDTSTIDRMKARKDAQ